MVRSIFRYFRLPQWVALAVALVASLLTTACSDWLGQKGDAGAGSGVGSTGLCSGTPLPCSSLSGGSCSTTLGCVDNGSCSGSATNIGDSCTAAFSVSTCNGTPGCVWVSVCGGDIATGCYANTEASCVAVQGCTWTPTSTTGTSTSCAAIACSANTDCGCGLTCVIECNGCSGTCGHPCYSSADCAGATDSSGNATPNCSLLDPTVTAPYSGRCTS